MSEINTPQTASIAIDLAQLSAGSPWQKIVDNLVSLIQRGYQFSTGLSGGKDSTVTVILVLRAIAIAKEKGIPQTKHFVTSASTKVDNPAMDFHRRMMLDEIRLYAEQQQIPVEVIETVPALPQQFQTTVIGRGTLPRFVENSAKTGRACSIDWKVGPQTDALKRVVDQMHHLRLTSEEFSLSGDSDRTKVVVCIGTRRSESTARQIKMDARKDSQWEPVPHGDNVFFLSPIMDWTYEDVWEFLMQFTTQDKPFETFNDGDAFIRLHQLYKDSNEGQCGILIGESSQQSPCGSREGCYVCGVVGDRDRSFENMVKEPRHAHLAGLNKLRNYIMKTRWDLSKRELVGRTLVDGYVPIRPDVYRLDFRKQLLKMMLTLDAREIERAEQVEADIVVTGRLEDTPENRYLSYPHFQTIDECQLLLIEFYWGLHHYASHAFEAVELWHQVHEFGRRYEIPEVEEAKKVPIPEKRWFKIGNYNREAPTDGLRSYSAECWNPYRYPDRPAYKTHDGEKVVYHENDISLSVDKSKIVDFMSFCFDNMVALRHDSALEGSRFLLNEGIIRIANGKAGQYSRMAKRGQYFTRLAQRLQLTPAELDKYLTENSISDEEFTRETMSTDIPTPTDAVLPMFETRSLF